MGLIQGADGWPSLVLNDLPPFSLMLIPFKTCLLSMYADFALSIG
jgi:hypothetical protein